MLDRSRKLWDKLGYYRRMVRGLHALLSTPPHADPEALIRRQLANRGQVWMDLVRRVVFSNPENPYHRMFDLAGCTYEDLKAGVERDGLEATLAVLHRAGVYLSHDEVKRKKPIVRGNRAIESETASFRNPFVKGGMESTSGGSRSAGTKTFRGVPSRIYGEARRWLRVREFGVQDREHVTVKPALPAALKTYVESGGNVVVTPFTVYMSWDGIFRKDGFAANLAELTGASVRTARRMGTSADKGREDQRVAWLGRVSPVGIDGYCEYLDVRPGAEVMGRFQSAEPVLNGQPAATRKRHGKGSGIKLAFWPNDDSVAQLFRSLLPASRDLLAATAPRGVQAVPRADGSLFVVNTSADARQVRFARTAADRISGRKLETATRLKPYEVLWIE